MDDDACGHAPSERSAGVWEHTLLLEKLGGPTGMVDGVCGHAPSERSSGVREHAPFLEKQREEKELQLRAQAQATVAGGAASVDDCRTPRGTRCHGPAGEVRLGQRVPTVELAPPSGLSFPPGSTECTARRPFQLSPTFTGLVEEWTIGGHLPEGLVFDTATGIISGMPTRCVSRCLRISAKNKAGTTDCILGLLVSRPVAEVLHT